MVKHYICIGSSAAGLAAASKLRHYDAQARITVLTAQTEMPYNRCSLADYLAGERSLEQIRTRTASFFNEQQIVLKRDTRVVEVRPQAQVVVTADGQIFGYDKLFLGMGKTARLPDLPGIGAQGVFNFYGLDDSNAILTYIKHYGITNCLIVGAGITGLECADALRKQGLKVSLVQRSSRLLSHSVDEQASIIIEKLLEKYQVDLYKNTAIREILAVQDRVSGVVLQDGQIIATQMIIFTVGSISNSAFSQAAGIAVEYGGIKVNNFLQTSVQHIYAGGDVAVVNNLLTGESEINSLWADAGIQGMFAASNMVGELKQYDGILPITNTTFFGTNIAFVGYHVHQAYEDLTKHQDAFYHRFMFHDGVLKGFIMIGNMLPIGKLKQALLSKQIIQAALKKGAQV